MRLGPCNITDIVERAELSILTRSLLKEKNITSCLKVRRFYNIHQQQRLRVLQQDCFHIKNVQKQNHPD